ncbi:P-loop containing nucleoside triphosphate hydrolase protein [Aspergillus leporis]|uniref:ATP-dependent DNA helicase n=1 Tax=Aspergillus leporis TaxID=41062 RepID=A0A5N5WJL9_9EURO|nr:P-loop containing nucleoside triphosphate hydrolase protein [Aspergillus leporis]
MLNSNLKHRKVDLDFYLHRIFRKKSFRPLQREVITAAVEGHDVFLQASTSFGKSLCFQLPAVISHGDQVNALQAIGVVVATINSTTSLPERREIMADLLSGHPRTRLLYVTPELCQTETFRRNLQTIHAQGELSRIAIDEAHCISEWGHDFRPAYKELSWFKRVLNNPSVPISALTATATPRVRRDIISLLGLDSGRLRIFNTPSARPNIHYEIRYLRCPVDADEDPATFQILDFISWLKSIQERREARLAVNGSSVPPITGIIYVAFRSVSEKLASDLSLCWDGNIRAVAYHAGLSSHDRTQIQSQWTSPQSISTADGKNPAFYIIVATNAFGMGIDNPHVRFVVHWSPPRSFEGFVQESGRAGRDGRAAASIVYYNTQERDRVLDRLRRDIESASNRAKQKPANGAPNNEANSNLQNQYARLRSFQKVVRYCDSTSRCRHEMIKDFFGDLELKRMGSQTPNSEVNTIGSSTSPCDFACDFCKEGSRGVALRRAKMALEDGLIACIESDFMMTMEEMYPDAFSGDD